MADFQPVLLRNQGVEGSHTLEVYESRGCEECKETQGYKGDIAVVEVLPVTSTIQQLLKSAAGKADIEAAAREEGMLTLLEDALAKSIKGEVAIESVIDLAQS